MEGNFADKLDYMFGVKSSFFKVEPGYCLLPPNYAFFAKKIRDMKIYEDDIWVVSYPRTGSHWVQEMVWCIGNNFDYETTKTLLVKRNPLLEASVLMVTGNYVDWFSKLGDSVENVVNASRPRYIKSHLPWDLLPTDIHLKKPKIIYITRNPKDTCVSFYHYCKLFHNMKGNFEDFAELFVNDNGIKCTSQLYAIIEYMDVPTFFYTMPAYFMGKISFKYKLKNAILKNYNRNMR